jgi:hypothetical protein
VKQSAKRCEVAKSNRGHLIAQRYLEIAQSVPSPANNLASGNDTGFSQYLSKFFSLRIHISEYISEINYVDDLEFHLSLGKDQFFDRM